MKLPRGKIIEIMENGSNILPPDIKMTIDSEVTLSLNSSFDGLFGKTDINKTATMFTGALHSITGMQVSASFKEMGYKVWTGTDPASFSFTTTFNMKTNAERDVVNPAKILMKLVLPKESDNNGFGLLAPGPTVLSALGAKTTYSKKYSFRCGIIYMPNVIFTKAEPTFSSETDTNGNPIWCTLAVDVSTNFVATDKLIDGFEFTNRE